jgi:NAD(P)-dependent dehydrogenase (short-subunit alcohol dehydrogenase family)
LSGLGLSLARWLAQQGAGRLVLLGRRGLTPEAGRVVEDISALGTKVVTAAIDVTDATALEVLLQRLRCDGPPLRGVAHCAGVYDDGALVHQDAERFTRVLHPKITGSSLLDRMTRSDPLDWFVLFSSAASILGSAGQVNYCAANAYLDLVARQRKSLHLPALSINWCAWAETGAAAGGRLLNRLSSLGMGSLSSDQALALLPELLCGPAAQVAVLPMNWAQYLAETGRAAAPFFANVANAGSTTGGPAFDRSHVKLRARLAGAPAGRCKAIVTDFVRERVQRALGLTVGGVVDPELPLGELGLDSLLAVELRNNLSAELETPLTASLLFDYPTINRLTDHLINDVLDLGGDAEKIIAEAVHTPASSLFDAVEELSDDEVDRLLASRFAGEDLK